MMAFARQKVESIVGLYKELNDNIKDEMLQLEKILLDTKINAEFDPDSEADIEWVTGEVEKILIDVPQLKKLEDKLKMADEIGSALDAAVEGLETVTNISKMIPARKAMAPRKLPATPPKRLQLATERRLMLRKKPREMPRRMPRLTPRKKPRVMQKLRKRVKRKKPRRKSQRQRRQRPNWQVTHNHNSSRYLNSRLVAMTMHHQAPPPCSNSTRNIASTERTAGSCMN